jgi:hypothetical protein
MRRLRAVLLAVAVLIAASACAPPEASPQPEGVRRVVAYVRGIT